MIDRTTLFVIASGFIAALLCILPETQGFFPFRIMAAGLHIGNTLFHELGHTVFAWLFGQPAIPMIFTLFGADQAGGMSLMWERNWFTQIAAFAGLFYGCWWAKENTQWLFIPCIIFSLLIVGIAFTRYPELIILYMGHGGSILVGGFLLFRAWIYLDSRNQYERWLNALFGFFLILCNFKFAYDLAYSAAANDIYSEHVAFGISHNDFKAIAEIIPRWSVKGIAQFTIGYCMATIIGAFILALWLEDSFSESRIQAEN